MTNEAAHPKVSCAEVAPTRRQGGLTRALLTPASVGATAGFMGTLTLRPGEYVAEHYHPYSDEFMFVVRGAVDARLDGAKLRLEAEESVMVRRGTRHRLECAGDEEAFIVFHLGPLAPRPELGHVDTEPLPYPDEPVPRVGGPS
ncbi:cupin domain-containing protein [Nonomuraea aridisoli]|uniref:Cupin domain-containing protein n=1 Tax=Nonomuraea aridisoli TaxID=2070368 RepID=A0A2W2FV89_9ACTN|nr:cupin domain-containing protein [Nonomuraea aridisoli]PZG18734.1 cupin domain-containing protein [Nonomuraea aridisoli]